MRTVQVEMLRQILRVERHAIARRFDHENCALVAEGQLVAALRIGDDDFAPVGNAPSRQTFGIGRALASFIGIEKDEATRSLRGPLGHLSGRAGNDDLLGVLRTAGLDKWRSNQSARALQKCATGKRVHEREFAGLSVSVWVQGSGILQESLWAASCEINAVRLARNTISVVSLPLVAALVSPRTSAKKSSR